MGVGGEEKKSLRRHAHVPEVWLATFVIVSEKAGIKPSTSEGSLLAVGLVGVGGIAVLASSTLTL